MTSFRQTFVLPFEYDALRKAASCAPEALWIRKPAARAHGIEVHLVARLDKLATDRSGVVQRYVHRVDM